MKNYAKHTLFTLATVALLSACSRPVATFQPSQRESFARQAPVAVQPVAETPVVAEAPQATAPAVVATPAEAPTAQIQAALAPVEALVRNDSKLANNRKVEKKMARMQQLIASASEKTNTASVASTKKLNLMERSMLKKIDKKINKRLAPNDTQALERNVRNGIIIGAIGLILALIFGGPIGIIGYILLLVGLVLILLGLLD